MKSLQSQIVPQLLTLSGQFTCENNQLKEIFKAFFQLPLFLTSPYSLYKKHISVGKDSQSYIS